MVVLPFLFVVRYFFICSWSPWGREADTLMIGRVLKLEYIIYDTSVRCKSQNLNSKILFKYF